MGIHATWSQPFRRLLFIWMLLVACVVLSEKRASASHRGYQYCFQSCMPWSGCFEACQFVLCVANSCTDAPWCDGLGCMCCCMCYDG